MLPGSDAETSMSAPRGAAPARHTQTVTISTDHTTALAWLDSLETLMLGALTSMNAPLLTSTHVLEA